MNPSAAASVIHGGHPHNEIGSTTFDDFPAASTYTDPTLFHFSHGYPLASGNNWSRFSVHKRFTTVCALAQIPPVVCKPRVWHKFVTNVSSWQEPWDSCHHLDHYLHHLPQLFTFVLPRRLLGRHPEKHLQSPSLPCDWFQSVRVFSCF